MYSLFSHMLRPYTLLIILSALALAYLWVTGRGQRRKLLLLTVPLGAFILLCTPAVVHVLLGTLEWQYPPMLQRPADTDAIVVLAGSIRPPDASRAEPELEQDTLYRCLHAVALYKQGPPCRILVSGGHTERTSPELSCAGVMRDFLVKQGVAAADVVLEDQSLTTYENAARSREVLEPLGVRRILLITDATHLPRAVRCFQKQGFDVTASGCYYRLGPSFDWDIEKFLPSPYSATQCELVFHEWLGIVWYWCNGRI